MIPQISKALASGFTAKQIIDFIIKKFPERSDQIKSAMAAGFTVEQIVKFIGGGRKALSELERVDPNQGLTEHERTRGMDIQRRENVNKAALTGAGLAASSLAAPIVANTVQRALPKVSGLLQATQQQLGMPQIPETPSSQQSQTTNVSQQPPIVSPESIAQSVQIAQPKGIAIDANQILSKHNSKVKIDELVKSGNGLDQIVGYFKKFSPKVANDIEKESGQPFEKVIEQYLSQAPKEAIAQNMTASAPVETKLSPTEQLTEKPEEKKPIAKNETVATPQGIGEVKEIRNGQALVEVDGKLHKVKEEELQPEPEEVKTATFGFDPSEVPEDLRSAPLNEVYLPHDRRHITVKYNAGLKPIRYIYFRKDKNPISTDYINKIVQGVQLPVTSGLSFWGAWDASKSDSRGAANYEELVSNAQEEGEPDDPDKDYWFIKEEALYEHPYLEKAGKEQLRAMEKEFNEKRKKPRKKKT